MEWTVGPFTLPGMDIADAQPVVTSDWTDQETVTEAVVKTVAAASGKPLTEIDCLYEVVDPDALEGIFSEANRGMNGSEPAVEFVYNGLLVRVRNDGHVALFDRDRSSSSRR